MKKHLPPFLAGMLTMALVGSIGVSALAASGAMTITVDPINIQVNGQVFQPKDAKGNDVPVFALEGTTYAPLRALAEAYGLVVGYDAAANMAVVSDPKAATSPSSPDVAALIDDSNIRISYNEIFEADGVPGVCYLRLTVENKTNEEVWVYITDASVNGISTTVMSGVPMVIQPGTSSVSPFIISYSNLGVSSISELKDMKFKAVVENYSDSSEIETTKEISITF